MVEARHDAHHAELASLFIRWAVENDLRAILATAHKLLRVIHTVLRDDRPYTDPGIDYERLVVERNAPRWIRMLTQHGFLAEAQAVRN